MDDYNWECISCHSITNVDTSFSFGKVNMCNLCVAKYFGRDPFTILMIQEIGKRNFELGGKATAESLLEAFE